jgi:hypothetical protein
MELLLNILWLALALPAFWVWRRKPECAVARQRFGGYCPVLLLGCVLVLLFPVVSATDDLHAMRPEMEESNPFSSVHKQYGASRASAITHSTGNFLASFVPFSLHGDDEFCGLTSISSTRLPEPAPFSQEISRGPPTALLG